MEVTASTLRKLSAGSTPRVGSSPPTGFNGVAAPRRSAARQRLDFRRCFLPRNLPGSADSSAPVVHASTHRLVRRPSYRVKSALTRCASLLHSFSKEASTELSRVGQDCLRCSFHCPSNSWLRALSAASSRANLIGNCSRLTASRARTRVNAMVTTTTNVVQSKGPSLTCGQRRSKVRSMKALARRRAIGMLARFLMTRAMCITRCQPDISGFGEAMGTDEELADCVYAFIGEKVTHLQRSRLVLVSAAIAREPTIVGHCRQCVIAPRQDVASWPSATNRDDLPRRGSAPGSVACVKCTPGG